MQDVRVVGWSNSRTDSGFTSWTIPQVVFLSSDSSVFLENGYVCIYTELERDRVEVKRSEDSGYYYLRVWRP